MQLLRRATNSLPPLRKILVVDGFAKRQDDLRTVLRDLECDVIGAPTTSEALMVISTRRIDLVLVDEFAPEVGGAEFCRLLKRNLHTQFLPIFVVAESDDIDAEILALNSGADEYLVRPLRPKALRARVESSLRRNAIIESIDDSDAAFFSLARSVEERDPATASHCERLAVMSATMGVALGLGPQDILTLHRAGYLHDIGKVAIPDRILFKSGPLTPEEWEIMKTHAERGERICAGIRSLQPLLPIIRHHHERWDGTGYPDNLKGKEIPLLARILQLSDIYDALTTERPYKPAFTAEESVQILKTEASKGWRDPELVDVFSSIVPMFYSAGQVDKSATSLQALAASLERYPSSRTPIGSRPAKLVS
jgi:putative two-component system response regulator